MTWLNRSITKLSVTLHGAERRHPADIVATEIQQHQMLGAFLRVGQQFGLQRLILFVGRAAPARARQRPDRHRAVAQPHQDLRAGAHDGKAAEIEEEQERRRIDPPQRAIQRERRQGERHREALAQHDLERVAGGDVFLAAHHRGQERLPW